MSDSEPSLAHDAAQLRMAAFRMTRRLRQERAVDSMSDGQLVVLFELRARALTLTELAELARVTAPSMNRTVNCLEEQGYIARAQDASDRRKINITITASGLRLIQETQRMRDAWLEDALRALTPEQREILDRAVPVLKEIADR